VVLPVQYRLMRDEITPISEFKQAIVQDLSGGGMLMEVKTPLANGSLVEISLPLPKEKDPVTAIGKVGFVKTEKKGTEEVFGVGLEFVAMEERERDKIVKFILARQRELVKKGIIR